MLTVNLEELECDATAANGLRDVIPQLQAAKRIVVICGAGISTSVGIPDFRSSGGLFSSNGNGNVKGKGKAQDLFHIRSLTVSHSLVHQLIIVFELVTSPPCSSE
jgi:NAD-dependent SIR2 family protein deacetylase